MKTKCYLKGFNFLSKLGIRCHSCFFLNIREVNSTFRNQEHNSFFLILIFYCYSITVVSPLSPSLHPTPAEHLPPPPNSVHVSFIVVPVKAPNSLPPQCKAAQVLTENICQKFSKCNKTHCGE